MKELVTNKGQGSLTPLKAFSCFHTDVFSDFTLARQGYPRMAFSACFGGIIFSILSAVALPSVLGAKDGLYSSPSGRAFTGTPGAGDLAAWASAFSSIKWGC